MDGGESVVCVCNLQASPRGDLWYGFSPLSLPSPLSYQLIQSTLKAAAAKPGGKTLLQYSVAQEFAKFNFYQSI